MSLAMNKKTHTKTGLRWLWVSLLVLAVDRVTKSIALQKLTAYQPKPLTSFFNFTLAYNKGAAFSFLNNYSGWQSWFLGGVAIIISTILFFWLHSISSLQRWRSIALALIIGGALGNLWDRILYGHVIDFIEFYYSRWHFPVFNLADSAICAGAFMLFFEAFFAGKGK